jgi:hypothetical protein
MKAFSFLAPMVAHAVTISTAIPGMNANSTSSSPGAFVANFYQFALIIGGILAFGVIVYGGIKYMMSAGNPSAASDAKEWIEAALLGLLLLAGAYFVLSVVNPQLLNLNLPSLSAANVATTDGGSAPTDGPTGACQANSCSSGYTCQATNTDGNVTHTCIQGGSGSNTTTCISGQYNTNPCVCPGGGQANLVQYSTNTGKANGYTCPTN